MNTAALHKYGEPKPQNVIRTTAFQVMGPFIKTDLILSHLTNHIKSKESEIR